MINSNTPLISVVLPIYKVETYIEKCIQSILDQTYKDLEIILVDDGSPDACPQICDEYAQSDSRFKVIHKTNGGLISAWSAGVEAASSEYIAFIDPDDWVSPRYIEIMADALVRTSADIVSCSLTKVCGTDQAVTKVVVPPGFYDHEKMKQEVYPVFLNAGDFELRGVPTSRCAKLIRKELICENMGYLDRKVTYSEDLSIIFPVFLSASSLYMIDDPECMYYYRYNPDSMLNAYDKHRLRSIEYVHPTLLKICEDKGHPEMVAQVYADFLAASVQYFKNELMNPEGLKTTRKNISDFIQKPMLHDAIRTTKWKHYRKLNVLVIMCMQDYNWFHKWITTSLLKFMKILVAKYKAIRS